MYCKRLFFCTFGCVAGRGDHLFAGDEITILTCHHLYNNSHYPSFTFYQLIFYYKNLKIFMKNTSFGSTNHLVETKISRDSVDEQKILVKEKNRGKVCENDTESDESESDDTEESDSDTEADDDEDEEGQTDHRKLDDSESTGMSIATTEEDFDSVVAEEYGAENGLQCAAEKQQIVKSPICRSIFPGGHDTLYFPREGEKGNLYGMYG